MKPLALPADNIDSIKISKKILQRKAVLSSAKLSDEQKNELLDQMPVCFTGITMEKLEDIYSKFGFRIENWLACRKKENYDAQVASTIKSNPTTLGQVSIKDCSVEDYLFGILLEKILRYSIINPHRALFKVLLAEIPDNQSHVTISCCNDICNFEGDIVARQKAVVQLDRFSLHQKEPKIILFHREI